MLVVKKPSAILYNWHQQGTFELISDVYFQESLEEKVIVYSLPYTGDVESDFALYKPDLVIYTQEDINITNKFLQARSLKYSQYPANNVLANDIVCQSTFRNCTNIQPRFSVFTPTYKTEERIIRTYESLNLVFGSATQCV